MATPITAPQLKTPISLTESVTTTSAEYTVQQADRMSIQVNATDATPATPVEFVAADVTPSVFAEGTLQVLDYAALSLATITVAGHDLVEGTDFDAETSDDVTATNIAAAIDALAEVTASAATDTVTVVAATAGAAGNDIDMSTDALPADLLLSGTTLEGGEDLSYIDAPSHGFVTGLKIPLTGTNLPTGTSATNYWAIVVDEDTLRLATSYALAVAGTFVIISGAGTTNDAALTPSALGSSTVEVLASLDGITYFSYDTPKEIDITDTSNQFLDCGQLTVPYIKIEWTAPTAGALTLEVLAWFQNTQVKNNS